MKTIFKCKEAAKVCDKAQYNEASFLSILYFKMHLLMCKFCRGHSSRNAKLTAAIQSSNLKTLRPEEKQLLKKRLQEHLNTDK